mmetsp:Transcript_131507/g.195935  ORF Transcript_131507/g.195935 Transcript_131507/m.195935 type:complete len:373 (-) Transcript_131507:39-1157(-)
MCPGTNPAGLSSVLSAHPADSSRESRSWKSRQQLVSLAALATFSIFCSGSFRCTSWVTRNILLRCLTTTSCSSVRLISLPSSRAASPSSAATTSTPATSSSSPTESGIIVIDHSMTTVSTRRIRHRTVRAWVVRRSARPTHVHVRWHRARLHGISMSVRSCARRHLLWGSNELGGESRSTGMHCHVLASEVCAWRWSILNLHLRRSARLWLLRSGGLRTFPLLRLGGFVLVGTRRRRWRSLGLRCCGRLRRRLCLLLHMSHILVHATILRRVPHPLKLWVHHVHHSWLSHWGVHIMRLLHWMCSCVHLHGSVDLSNLLGLLLRRLSLCSRSPTETRRERFRIWVETERLGVGVEFARLGTSFCLRFLLVARF